MMLNFNGRDCTSLGWLWEAAHAVGGNSDCACRLAWFVSLGKTLQLDCLVLVASLLALPRKTVATDVVYQCYTLST